MRGEDGGLQALDAPSLAARIEDDGVDRRTPSPWEVGAVLIAGAIAIGLLILTAAQAYLYAPMADVIDWAARVFTAERDGNWLGYLWDPHTAQRIPLARLAEAVDIEVARGRWPSFLIATAATWLCGLAGPCLLLVRAKLTARTRLWLGFAVVVLATNIGLAEDFAFPVFSVYLFVAGPVLAAACLLQTAPRDGLKSAAFWGALALASAASGGNAAGLAIWPALFVASVMSGRDRAQLIAILVVAAAVGAAVEMGLGAPSSSLGRASGSSAAHLIKMATYVCTFGGLPWTRAMHTLALGALAGAAVWTLAAVALTRAAAGVEDGASQPSRAGVVLILFGLVAAILATIGRVDELADPIVPTRYTPFATLMQIGVVLAFSRDIERAMRRGWAARATLAALGVLILVNNGHQSHLLLRAAARIREASETFDRTGVQGDVLIYPEPSRAIAVRRQLAARGLPH